MGRVTVGVLLVAMVIGSIRIGYRSFAQKMSNQLFAVDFEVFGKVQGVFFRKCTEEEATKLGIRGWCKNTPEGTVQGQLEGPKDQIDVIQSSNHKLSKSGEQSQMYICAVVCLSLFTAILLVCSRRTIETLVAIYWESNE